MSAECMQKNRDCWGDVAVYSLDLDLPNVTLCRGHVWELMQPKTRYEKYAVAEALDESCGAVPSPEPSGEAP